MQPTTTHEAPDLVLVSLVLLWAALEAALVLLIALVALTLAATGRGPSRPLLPVAPAAPALPVVITPALPAPAPSTPLMAERVVELRRRARAAGVPAARVRRARREELLTLLSPA